MAIEQIAPRSVQVRLQTEVADRQFELREQTLRETGEFVVALDAGMKAEMEAANTPASSPEELFDRLASQLEPALLRILRHPIDGLGPATPEFVQSLRLSQRKWLLTMQSELNHLQDEGIAGKVSAALQVALAWQAASAGFTGAGKPATASPPSTASPRWKLMLRGLCDRLKVLRRGSGGASGLTGN